MTNDNLPKPEEINELIPSMNVSVPAKTEEQEQENLVSDELLIGIYGEIIDNLRNDRKEIDDVLTEFIDMVVNSGDSTTSSKEALVNLMKIKSETADKMAKVADLMTRVKLKERDTFPRYLAAKQENTINIGNNSKRDLIKQIDKMQKLKNKKKEEEK